MTDKKLSVLMVGPARDAQGGIATVINGYFRAGLPDACDLRFVGTTSNGNNIAKGIAALRALHEFDRLLPGCDLVHIHLGGGVSIYRKQLFMNHAVKAGKPVVAHVHVNLRRLFSGHSASFKNRYRRFLSRATKVIVLSGQEKQFYIENNLCEPENIIVFHNAIEIPDHNYFDDTSADVVFLGHMSEIKGPDVLVRAVPRIVSAIPQAKVIFAGDGDASPYRALAQSLGVASQCRFVGWVNSGQKEDILKHAYVYVQPSRDEGMSMSLLESMARGIPVVATDVGGTSLVVHDGVDGFLVPSLDSRAISDQVIKLFQDTALARTMSFEARSNITDHFDINKQVVRLVDIYHGVMSTTANIYQSRQNAIDA